MTEPLRPMKLGEILDLTFQIYRSKFFALAGIATLPALMMMGIRFVNEYWWKLRPPPTPLRFLGIGLGNMVFVLAIFHLSLLFHVFVWPCFVYTAKQSYLGEPRTGASGFSLCAARWRSWLGITTLFWGATLIVPELLSAILLLGILFLLSEVIKVGEATIDAVVMPLLVGFTALGWWAALRVGSALVLAFPTWVLEGMTVGKAFRRGWVLSKGSRWRIVFSRIVLALISYLLTVTLSEVLLLTLLFFTKQSSHWWSHYGNVVAGVTFLSTAAVSTLVGPLFPVAITLFYYDQRIRHEGYDIEWMMNAAGLNPPATASAGELAAAQPKEQQA